MYKIRIEIQNPGGVFGRLSTEEIGSKKKYDARNPGLVKILEELGIVENRGSGIPTMIEEMIKHGLEKPKYIDYRGDFVVSFFGVGEIAYSEQDSEQDKFLKFLETPKTKKEISEFLGISSLRYLKEAYVENLMEAKKIKMTIPNKPTSKNQRYVIVNKDS